MFICTGGTNGGCSAWKRQACLCHPLLQSRLATFCIPEQKDSPKHPTPALDVVVANEAKLAGVNDYKRATRLRPTCCSVLLPGRSRTADIHPCHCSGPSAQAARGNITGAVTKCQFNPIYPKGSVQNTQHKLPLIAPQHYSHNHQHNCPTWSTPLC